MKLEYNPYGKELKPNRVLGIDPGETTGWALLSPEGLPVVPKGRSASMFQERGLESLALFLESLDPSPGLVVVYERYVVSQLESDINTGEHETIQAIGVVKSWCYRNKIPFVGQLRTVKNQGYGWHHTIRSPGIKNDSHRRDAHAHAVYFLVTNKLMKVRRIPK